MPTSPEYYQKNKARILEYSRKKYLDDKEKYLEYQRQYRLKNREKINKKTKDKRANRLLEAINLLGGQCSKCLQKFDPVCYDFHHLDPKEKDVTIGENMLISKDRFFAEVKKCILLCSNCHRLTHKELRNAD